MEYLICIQSVLTEQYVMSITEQDVEDTIALSYTVDADSGEVSTISPDEIMMCSASPMRRKTGHGSCMRW